MTHHIEAIITKDPINVEVAKSFDLPHFSQGEFTIVALYPDHIDHWSKQLSMPYAATGAIRGDCQVTHHFAAAMGLTTYALIMTDYFGGVGEQYASVYSNGDLVITETEDGINKALKAIGVVAVDGKDEFDTIGLGEYRRFDGYFASYEN